MQFASLFQDHAILQRHASIPVWGTGTPGERVTVRLAEHEAVAVIDAAGRWFLRLPPRGEGGPYTLRAEDSSGAAVEIHDVLVGEVWICSGQSNMQWTLERIGGETDLPTLPHIRLLTVTNPPELGRADAVDGKWEPCAPASLAAFSAVGGYFGRRLHEKLGVPVGLICNAFGGTRAQAWISREGLVEEPEGRDEIRLYESYLWKKGGTGLKTYREWELSDAPQDTGNLGLPQGWATTGHDDTAWEPMELPAFWQQRGHPYSGIFWFRHRVKAPASWAGRELELSLGAIDKHDEAWVNGCLVGSTGREVENAWTLLRRYTVPAGLVDEGGEVLVALRVRSHVFAGGFTGPAEAMWIAPVGAAPEERLSLAGAWASKVEQNWGAVEPPRQAWGPGNPNSPGILFDNRVAPLIPYAFRGVIWYQGESNAAEAPLYRRLIAGLIRDWRRVWGAGDFPFLQVQLANFKAPQAEPSESAWAALREAQASALSLEATGLAVSIDIGEADDVHPRNKRDVGLRLAQSALHHVYHVEAVPMGPLFTGITLEADGRVRCFFRHTAGQLIARGEGSELRHFAVAGVDRVFHWAKATIEGETVVVSCPKVPSPCAVRYAWADNPEGCNLYNRLELPAAPFRSDSWPVG